MLRKNIFSKRPAAIMNIILNNVKIEVLKTYDLKSL